MAVGQPRILWLSRHEPGDERMAGLRRLFGEDCVVEIDTRPFPPNGAVEDIAGRMRSGRFDEIVLVAPTSILDGLCRAGVRPLWPTMSADRRDFLGFDRVIGIRKEKREVAPEAGNGKRILWIARFLPATSQLAELRRLFGADVAVTHRDIPNAEEVEREFRHGGFDALVAVVPEAVFERLSALELPLLRSEAMPEDDPAKVEFRGGGGKGFRFDRYVWYSVEKETRRL